MPEKEKKKAFDEKVKRFDKKLMGLLTNAFVSMVTAILTYIALLR